MFLIQSFVCLFFISPNEIGIREVKKNGFRKTESYRIVYSHFVLDV